MHEIQTLVFTDLVDSMRLNRLIGDERMAALWEAHDRATRRLVRACHGREVGRSDGFLLLFADVADAVAFARLYHRTLATLEVPMLARVGLHTGPVQLRENSSSDVSLGATPYEVDGLALPIAARVMSIAQGGQTLLSGQTAAELDGTVLRAHGHWVFKGQDQPIAVFEAAWSDGAVPPPVDTEKAYRVVLIDGAWQPTREISCFVPAERDVFVGRTAELQSLADRFRNGARLVSVTGMGGIGKTRLVCRYARLWLGDHAGGTWFCDLSAARGFDDVLAAVATGLRVTLGRGDPADQLGAVMAGRGECLVILDNFEQVVAHAESTVGRWLERAPRLRVLVTSRDVLAIQGEHVNPLAPMSGNDAQAMLRRRIQAAGVDGPLPPEDEAAMAPLAELLDGLPLAIELAAARAPLLGPGAMLARMGDRLSLLTTRGRRVDRHATMRATLDWSWGLLSPVEQSTLVQLAAFEGGFTLEAAQAVVSLSTHRHPPDIINILQSLVEKSLLHTRDHGRLEMLRTVLDYVREQPSSMANQTLERHSAYFATLFGSATILVLAREYDNLLAALRRAVAAGRMSDAIGALRGVWMVIKLRGPFRLISELAGALRAAPSDLSRAHTAWVDLIEGWGLKATGRTADAELRLQEALIGAQLVADVLCEGHAACVLGELYANSGRVEQARQALGAARRAAVGHDRLACDAYTALGNLHRNVGALDDARQCDEVALAAARRLGDSRLEGGCLGNLGATLANQGRNDSAQTCYEEALAIFHDLGDRQWEGNTRCNLGLLHQGQGRHEEARNELEASLRIARELGHVRLEGVVLTNLGLLAEESESSADAHRWYAEAREVARRSVDIRGEGQVLAMIGRLQAREGRFTESRDSMAIAESLLAESGDQRSLALLLCWRCAMLHTLGDSAAAVQCLERAVELARAVGDEPGSELRVTLDGVRARMASSAAA